MSRLTTLLNLTWQYECAPTDVSLEASELTSVISIIDSYCMINSCTSCALNHTKPSVEKLTP